MKKNFWFLIAGFVFAAASITTSCFLEGDDEDSNLIGAPKVMPVNGAIVITPLAERNTKQLTIVRKSEIGEKQVRICQIIPESGSYIAFNDDLNYIDNNTDSSKKYSYSVRYFDGNVFKNSKFTSYIDGVGTSEAELTGEPEIKYTRDDKTRTYTLEFTTDPTPPAGWDLYVVLGNGDITKPYPLSASLNMTTLDAAFLGKKIIAIGVVACKAEKKQYTWTPIINIKTTAIEWLDEDGNDISSEADGIFVPAAATEKYPLVY